MFGGNNMMKIITLSFLVFLIFCKQGLSNDKFISLNNYLKNVGSETYVFKRCSGLYQTLLSYGGDRLNKETIKSYKTGSMLFFKISFSIDIKNKLGDSDYVSKLNTEQIVSIAKIYRKRMDDNYLREGQALGNDKLIKDDVIICREILSQLK